MPRYCAVKACINRGGSAPRRDDKRVSFYPFPLQDKPRLRKWVDNMRREEWTPSRHQCLCSEHFTGDCFDIRWGIRYLKNTAVPTIFPSIKNDGEKKGSSFKRSPKSKPGTVDADFAPAEFDSPLSKRCQSSTVDNIVAEHTEKVFELPRVSYTGIPCRANLCEIQAAACEVPGDSEMPTASYLARAQCDKAHSEQPADADAAVTVLCCESLGPFSDGEANMDAAALQTALGQAFSFVPAKMANYEPTTFLLEESGPGQGEHISLYEHSYCRPDTDEDQLWSKILSLHAKILELDRREESTVANIRALETEVALLKRDGAVFKER
ncbi:THAP domain-containing protein 5-like isoform X1 [Scophthalmus maximus]|uniref:THAP domain-containing protein 5-like isoform X1 n=2 Tax=Scophthalmus maximus TaxID=52904 RepID=UPI001FA8B1D9|nr:THAP domain-containing protein 5-like isoform X1 [Scophthalmus maximus]